MYVVAESDGQLQVMIDELNSYYKMWNLEVNLDKSEVMTIRKKGGRKREVRDWYLMVVR